MLRRNQNGRNLKFFSFGFLNPFFRKMNFRDSSTYGPPSLSSSRVPHSMSSIDVLTFDSGAILLIFIFSHK
ncbi:hypothetical protein ACSQ67_004935 [Phaseolus vulgaris]